MISRRALLAGAAGLSACGPDLAKRFNGYALVANRGSRTLAAVNLTRFKTEKHIVLQAAPELVLAYGNGHAALVLAPDAGSVLEVTAESLGVSRRHRVAGKAIGMRIVAKGNKVWILSSEPHALVALDLATWIAGRTISIPFAARGFDVSDDGETAVVSYSGRNQCGLFNLRTGKPMAEIDLVAAPSVVRFRPDGKQVLIGSVPGRAITVADPVTGKVLVILPLPFGPARFCFGTDHGGQMFATGPGMDAVAIVYPYQTELAETVLAGREPGEMAVNDSLLFVTNPPTGDTTVISIAERQVVARIASGEEPCAVTLTPDGEYALVLNRKSGDMAVVRISKFTDLRYKRAPLFNVIAVGEEPVSAAVVTL